MTTDAFSLDVDLGPHFVAGESNVVYVSNVFDRLTRNRLGGAAGWINDATGTVTIRDGDGNAIADATDLALAPLAEWQGVAANGRYAVTLPDTAALERGTVVEIDGVASGHTTEDAATLVTFRIRGRVPVL